MSHRSMLQIAGKSILLSVLALGFFTSACSAKETTAKETPAKTAEVKTSESVNATQATVSTTPEVSTKVKAEVDATYTALFNKAKENVAAGLAENPRNFVAGAHYDEFPTRQPLVGSGDKIEVVEIFSYGCPACFNAEPYMHAYAEQVADDVEFIRIPASFNKPYELLARGFYAANALGVEKEAHIAIFDAIHVKKRQDLMRNPKALAGFYESYGVDKDKFLKTLNSFFVDSRIDQDRKLAQAYQVSGVPTVVVNGAYQTGGAKAGSMYAWFQILDTLTEKERAVLADK